MRPRYLLGLILILLFTAVGGLTLFVITTDSANDVNGNSDSEVKVFTDEDDQFALEARYIEDKWEYTLTGYLPDPCHSFTVTELIAESYPEQVTIQVEILPPENEIACVQVIQDVTYKEDFVASPNASINLVVVEATSDNSG
ncbi:MAG: hypothetical protein QY318_03190 [Candidatus Dojkabacteria bacterium]|nr:MAG: hypothetical protein QY318_03190 [Candidatus Dojkabacteria bacterium]